MQLETPRLILRPWTLADAPFYERMSQDIGYNCFVPPGIYLARDRSEVLAKIQQRIDTYSQHAIGKWPIFRKSDGVFLGTAGADLFDFEGQRQLELGYRLLLEHWEQGYATEAAGAVLAYLFNSLKAQSVFGFAVAQNKGSIRILQKLGFRYRQPMDHGGFEHQLYEARGLTEL